MIQADFRAPDPPPAYGTVLPAPAAETQRGGGRWAIAVVAIVVGISAAAFGGYWVASRSEPGEEAPLAKAAVVAPTGPVDGAEHQASSPPAKAAPLPPCPDGMVLVEGGKMFMGTDDEAPVLAKARPQHPVEVGDFCIDRTEVTVADYRACSKVGECKRAYRDSYWPQGSSDRETWEAARAAHSPLCNEAYDDRLDHPVNCVSWTQAVAYCEHEGKALPTEKQWEYAARGSDGRRYPWGDALPDSERINGCGLECARWRDKAGLDPTPQLYDADDGFAGTAPVGSFPAGESQHGIFDMAGNVFEWTADVYAPYDDAERLAEAPDLQKRVIRGGAFNSYMPQFADPALRFSQDSAAHAHGIGFRCAATVRGAEGG